MKTITFYSYKGGVGRSLALSNIATRLSELGQRVCIIDFDLEAPGLNFKFKKHNFDKKISKGVVDYIYRFSVENELPESIVDYSVQLHPGNTNFESITLIPAGEITNSEYWRKLSKINWDNLFYDKKAQGVKFFLDLKSKIERELTPDFLLIDSRTGITDIAGLTLKIFADQAIILGVNNEENIFGSKKIISALLDKNKNLNKKEIEINFVWTRCPYGSDEKEKELVVVDKLRNDFRKSFDQTDIDVSVIHSDRLLEREEAHLSASNYEYLPGSVSNDYFKLLEKIVNGEIDLDDQIIIKKRADSHFLKSMEESKNDVKFYQINKAIALDPLNYMYYVHRALFSIQIQNYAEARKDLFKARELNKNEFYTSYYLAYIDYQEKNYDNVLNELSLLEQKRPLMEIELELKGMAFAKLGKLDEAIDLYTEAIEVNPVFHRAFNSRANAYRKKGELDLALSDVEHAIQLVGGKKSSDEAVYLGTLAEIYFAMNQKKEFYFYLRLALNKGLKIDSLMSAEDIYLQLHDDTEFLSILKDYDMSMNDIIANSLFN